MSGVTPLVDTLLATRLGQRVDLVPLKGQTEIAGPGAAPGVEKVVNDVRLLSRNALQQQLGAGLLSNRDGTGLGSLSGKSDAPVTLSGAARALSAILNFPAGDISAVRGTAPLWPHAQRPDAPLLAANLARAVAGSGLFYESHLQQYLGGTRTLAQLAREPQAALPPPGKSPAAGVVSRAVDAASVAGLTARLVESRAAMPATPATAGALPAVTTASLVSALSGGAAATPTSAAPPGQGMAAPVPAGPAQQPHAADIASTYGRTAVSEHRQPPFHAIAGQVAGGEGAEAAEAAAPETARSGQPAAAIHPEAMTLVRQQLDLLALPVFRWTGEGWPGVPLDWEIREHAPEREDRQERPDDGGTPAMAAPWTTRMTLSLPRLGTVEVRLGLAGTALQLSLHACEGGTVGELTQARSGLAQRFAAAGLDLTDLQIRQLEPAGGAGAVASTGENHGR